MDSTAKTSPTKEPPIFLNPNLFHNFLFNNFSWNWGSKTNIFFSKSKKYSLLL